MAIYAIGDIQGCFADLQRLVEHLNFDPVVDTLWFVGDLVNRGPDSLNTLRFVRELGTAAVTVLGNHDLHLLAVSLGIQPARNKDTFLPVLHAPDAAELLSWLRQRPLLYYDATLEIALVHAGLPPQWDLATALACAGEVEATLKGPDHREFLLHMYGNKPQLWSPTLSGLDRWRYSINALTRMRYCDAEGQLDFKQKLVPGTQPKHLMPWFQVPWRQSRGLRIVFGHWSTLGFHDRDNVYALDTGCVWGGALTALRVDAHQPQRISIPCAGARRPHEAHAHQQQ
ncbi:MAG: symmetrical bis(5'-nucleosyl)-tetraphosphatase [Thiotrichales bacterium]